MLVRGGRLADGSGSPARELDLGIRGGRIVAIGPLADATATTIVEEADPALNGLSIPEASARLLGKDDLEAQLETMRQMLRAGGASMVYLVTLEEAIRKMTSLPAGQFGFHDRGRLTEGMAADLVVFDPATVADRATYESPHQYPAGIGDVLVNGVAVIENGVHTKAKPGQVLRHRR